MGRILPKTGTPGSGEPGPLRIAHIKFMPGASHALARLRKENGSVFAHFSLWRRLLPLPQQLGDRADRIGDGGGEDAQEALAHADDPLRIEHVAVVLEAPGEPLRLGEEQAEVLADRFVCDRQPGHPEIVGLRLPGGRQPGELEQDAEGLEAAAVLLVLEPHPANTCS